MVSPTVEEFKKKAKQGNLIPVYREILADMETPVSAFRKIDDGKYSFLLESVEGGEKWARSSFLGSRPEVVVRSFGRTVEVIRQGKKETRAFEQDPLEAVRDILSPAKGSKESLISCQTRTRPMRVPPPLTVRFVQLGSPVLRKTSFGKSGSADLHRHGLFQECPARLSITEGFREVPVIRIAPRWCCVRFGAIPGHAGVEDR